MSTLNQQVADLTTATTDLLGEVTGQKDRLTTAADTASDKATAASASAAEAAVSADEAHSSAVAAQISKNQASQISGLNTVQDAIELTLESRNYDELTATNALSLTKQNLVDVQQTYEDRDINFRIDETNQSVQDNVESIEKIEQELEILDEKIKNKKNGIDEGYKAVIESDFLVDGFTSGYISEILRGMGGSGLYSVRNYNNDTGFTPEYKPFAVSSTAQFMHNHPNYYRMVGLGELCAVVNGFYIRTTHNDPRLIDTDANELEAPAIPSNVLAKPTGITLNGSTVSIDTASDTQAKYMRNIFTDHIEDTNLNLVYMEVWLEKLPDNGDLSDNGESFRHQENAKKLSDLLNKAEALNFAGAKDTPENGSFRCGMITFMDEDGNPEYAYVNYRLRARNIGKLAPRVAKTTYLDGDVTPEVSFSVVASGFGGTHGHALEVSLSSSEMNTLIGGSKLYVESSYNRAEASPEDETHTHLWELEWSGSTITGRSLGSRTDLSGHSFVTASTMTGTPPVIDNYRMYDGTMSNASVTWIDLKVAHTHPLYVKVVQDRFPFDLYKAVNGIIDNNNRFKLIRDQASLERLKKSNPNATWKELGESNYARWHLDQDSMDSICESVWGLDGEGQYIPETIDSYGSNYSTYNVVGEGRLNMAKYNRQYKLGSNDAAGRTVATRGFNDPTLYVAKTTKENVVQQYTYMIPLELTVRAPTEIWNPWDLKLINSKPNSTNSSGSGSQSSPWNAAFTQLWYNMLPPSFFSAAPGDPADTVTGGKWIESNDGNAYPADNSGVYISLSNAANYLDDQGQPYSSLMRCRYAIAPLWHDYNHANLQLNNYKDTIRNVLKGIVGGTITTDDIDNLL